MLRHFRAKDLDSYRRIRLEALQTDPDAFGETAEGFAERSDSEITEWLTQESAKGTKTIAYVVDGGQPVAMCGFGVSDEDSTAGFLWGMFVSLSHRRQRLGELLLAEAESWLTARSVKAIKASVAAPNEDAIAFYRACGYSVGPPLGVLRPGSDIPLHEIEKQI